MEGRLAAAEGCVLMVMWAEPLKSEAGRMGDKCGDGKTGGTPAGPFLKGLETVCKLLGLTTTAQGPGPTGPAASPEEVFLESFCSAD